MNRLLAAAFNLGPIVAESRAFDQGIADIETDLRREPGAVVFGDQAVLVGNADLEASCDWLPPIAARPMAPLPGHEHAAALASIQLVPA